MARLAQLLGRSFTESSAWHSPESLTELLDTSSPDVLAIRNATPMSRPALPAHRGFHVIRDPRDIVVSGYYSHRYSHPLTEKWAALPKLRQELNELPFEAGLLREIEFDGGTFGAMQRWDYAQPNILELRLEDLMDDSFGGVMRVGEHLGVIGDGPLRARGAARFAVDRALVRLPGRVPARVPRDVWLGVAWDNRFEKLAGRARGDEDPQSHFRKGTPGSWREVFTPEHVAAFEERYPGLVEELGYDPA
jgi:hypothetical protein